MRIRYLCVLALSLILTAQSVRAASLGDEKAVRELAEQAMLEIAKGNVKGATEILAPHWLFAREQLDSGVPKVSAQRQLLQSRFGNSVGFLLVENTIAADSFLRLVYVEKFEKAAIRWLFTFYKPADEWRLNSFSIDDNIGALFSRLS